MNLEKIKWIATDIDGTLKPYECEYRAGEREALLKLVAAGAKLSIITGRPVHGALHYADIYGLTENPIVACNGALIYHAGEFVYKQAMPIEPLSAYIQAADKLGFSILVNSEQTEYCYRETEWVLQTRKARDPFPILPPNCLTSASEQMPVYKLAMMCKPTAESADLLFNLQAEFGEQYEIVLYANAGCEITAKGANKAMGLKHLAAYLNLPMAELAAIGDNENDIAMLQTAGVGVAVANAIVAVQQYADYVCANSATAGVAEFVAKVLQAQRGV